VFLGLEDQVDGQCEGVVEHAWEQLLQDV
jgi:hypothetical protein